MAKKKQTTASEHAQSQGGGGTAGGQALKKGAKTARIRELYGKGVTKAADVADAMKREGISVSMPVIYQTLARLKKGGGKAKRGGRPKAEAGQEGGAEQPHQEPWGSGPGLQPEDLVELADIARKAGGWDKLQTFISVLKRMG
jgi:hypothetical protein